MIRFKAAAVHLLLSLIVFASIIFIVMYKWYPEPYFSAAGGWQGLKIAAGVDLVLGPLLTFIVFDVKKSKMTIVGDMIVIVLIQLVALAWGVNTIYSQRPLAIVFWDDSFYTVPASSLHGQGVVADELQRFGEQSPVLVYAKKPTKLNELKAVAEIALRDKIPPHHQVNLYQSLEGYFSKIKNKQLDIKRVLTKNDKIRMELLMILRENNKEMDDYLYFPLLSKYRNTILIFSPQGELVNFITVPLENS